MIVIRDFNGLLIPSAMPILILAGTEVELTQNKGGFATIYAEGNLVRVSHQDLDAIGLSNLDISKNKNNNNKNINKIKNSKKTKNLVINPIDLELVWQNLRECYDPEIPVNIVDLGLIYGCTIKENTVIVTMTLTAPACGMGPVLIEDIKYKLLAIENVTNVEVEMVFDPPWSQERMSDIAKLELGLI